MGILLSAFSPLASASISVCPTNRTFLASSACTAELPDLTTELLTDTPAAVLSVTQSPLPGVSLPLGSNAVIFTVTYTNATTESCAAAVFVVDQTAPTITACPPNRTVAAGADCAFVLPDFTSSVLATDSCSAVSISQFPAAGASLSLGSHLLQFSVVDAASNTAACVMTLVVADLSPPELSVTPLRSVDCASPWSFETPTAVDACGSNFLAVLSTVTNAGCGATYTATRIWQATDVAGNSATCTQLVAVVDTTPPVVLGPSNLTVACGASWSFGSPLALDGCVATTLVYDNSVNDLLTRLEVGTNELGNQIILAGGARYLQEFSYEFWTTNLTGAAALAGTNVTVRLRFYANDGPAFHGYASPGTLLYDSGEFGLGSFATPRSTLVYSAADLWLYAAQPLFLALPDEFTWTVQFGGLAPDDRAGVDLYSLPVLGQAYGDYWSRSPAGWELRTLTPLRTDFAALARASSNHVSLTVLSTGTNFLCGATFVATRIWAATDACGNQTTCTQSVAVVDLVPPVVSVAALQTYECGTAWSFDVPVASDACGSNSVAVLSTVTNLGCGATYTATRIWQATDACGNSGTCTQVVAVVDTTPPLVTAAPDATNECGSAWTFTSPVVADTCGTNELSVLTTVTNPVAGGSFSVSRLWQVRDACGNTAACTQTVTVVDTVAPVVVSCPAARDLPAATNCTVSLPDFTAEFSASDACGGVWIVQSPPPGTVLGLGGHVISFTAFDAASNQVACLMNLGVVDVTPPVVVGGVTNLSLAARSNCTAGLPDLASQLTIADCSPYAVQQSPPAGTELALGEHSIRFTITDAATNVAEVFRLLAVGLPAGYHTNVSISEFMAQNTFTLADEDGDYSGWIEIRNAGGCPVNLAGWALTDEATNLSKWLFPATNLAAGQYLLVWASAKDRRTPGLPLHTNFKLAPEGEYLALVLPDGVTRVSQFTPRFVPQLPDISYGRPAGSSTSNYLASPTPGLPNSGSTNFQVAALAFNSPRGWYTNFVSVSLHTPTENLPGGVQIYWTTNGTLPTPTNGYLYGQRLYFSNTTVLRAVAYRTNYAPTPSVSHTYIFPTLVSGQTGSGFPTNWGFMTNYQGLVVPVPAEYTLSSNVLSVPRWGDQLIPSLLSLPTLSLVLHPDDMFGAAAGIYANSFGDGSAWERPCSVEYLRRDGSPGFQVNCGIRIQGGLSRDPAETPKHKLRLLFKAAYGPAFLVYNLYPDSYVNEFATLSLNAVFNDHWVYIGGHAQFLRDQWCADTQDELAGWGKHGTFVHLYINGLYWGLYDIGERPDGSYGAHYFGGAKSDYDAFNGPVELTDGDWVEWDQMLALATAGITNAASYSNLCHYLDVPFFIDYLLLNFYIANQDWPENNWRAVGAVPKGVPFRIFSWDAEISFYGTNWDSTFISSGYLGQLYTALRQYPEFRREFGDHAQQLLFNGGLLTPDRGWQRWQRRAAEIDSAIIAESARWGDRGWRVFTYDDWLGEQQSLQTNWFPVRTQILIDQLRARGLYPQLPAPVLTPHGGVIFGALPVTLAAPVGTVYYTTNGSDPRLPDGSLAPAALVADSPLTLTNTLRLSARAFATNTWSALVVADYLREADLTLAVDQISLRADGFVELLLRGYPGLTTTLQWSPNLVDWTALGPVTPLPDGTYRFLDRAAPEHPLRFYRLTWP